MSLSMIMAIVMTAGSAIIVVLPSSEVESVPKEEPVTGYNMVAAFGPLPSYIIRNEGQLGRTDVLYYYASKDLQVAFAQESILVKRILPGRTEGDSKGVQFRVTLIGASPGVLRPLGEAPHRSNFFLGDLPDQWRTNVPSFSELRREGAYPGIDVTYAATVEGLARSFEVDQTGDPSQIVLGYEGANVVEVDARGGLVVMTPSGDFLESPPTLFRGAVRQSCRYVTRGLLVAGIECQSNGGEQLPSVAPNPPRVLVPFHVQLLYSTYLGDTSADDGYALAVDASNNAYVTGRTQSVGFPTTLGAYDVSHNGNHDVYVTKLNSTGKGLVYSTFLGGSDYEAATSIALDGQNNAYIVGQTFSTNFPTQNPYQSSKRGLADFIISTINAAGNALLYSTYFGGDGRDADTGSSNAVDGSGNIYVSGQTKSSNFPTTVGAWDTSLGGTSDLIVAKLNPNALPGSQLLYSTYLGGSGADGDVGVSLAIDGSLNAYLTGDTKSSNFPTTPGAYDTCYGTLPTCTNGNGDGFITKLNPAGSGLVFSSFVGGTNLDYGYSSRAIRLDGTLRPWITGNTTSTDFPVSAPTYDNALSGGSDAFVLALTADGTGLVYGTYLGGSSYEHGRSLVLGCDALGGFCVTGVTTSADFPVATLPLDSTYNGGEDLFVTTFSASGATIYFSTYLGGSSNENPSNLQVDSVCHLYVTGSTTSTNYPTTSGAYDVTYNGGRDAFVTKLSQHYIGSPCH